MGSGLRNDAAINQGFAALSRICRWVAFFAAYRSVERVYQGLNLDELRPRSLGLVAIEGSGKYLCVRIPIFNHSISRFLQHFKPFAHLGRFQPLPNTLLRGGVARKQTIGRAIEPLLCALRGIQMSDQFARQSIDIRAL